MKNQEPVLLRNRLKKSNSFKRLSLNLRSFSLNSVERNHSDDVRCQTVRESSHSLDLGTRVMNCSEPTVVMSPRLRNQSAESKQAEISEAVSVWSGETENVQERRKTPVNKMRRRLSRTMSKDKLQRMNIISKENTENRSAPRSGRQRKSLARIPQSKSRSLKRSATFSFSDCMELVEMDPRITDSISLFYIQQQLPSEFPEAILQYYYSKTKKLSSLYVLFQDRGWKLSFPQSNIPTSVPEYYFGPWSYDCRIVFEGKRPGSFISCHKQNRYYVIYKTITGAVVLDVMSKGPRVSRTLKKKLGLRNGITRPPKRFICSACATHTPCELTKKTGHESLLSDFVITFPNSN